MWNDDFEMNDFEEQIYKLYQQILLLYKQLHAYVRHKLSLNYNTNDKEVIEKSGPLPAHLLGNMWAQEWASVYNMTVPYPGKVSLDVTPALIAQ
ncbi:hypothetical protein J6590_062467, partial [Homalodisca vitripennis]